MEDYSESRLKKKEFEVLVQKKRIIFISKIVKQNNLVNINNKLIIEYIQNSISF